MARARSVAARHRETSTSASGPDGARWGTTSMATRPAARPGPRSSSSSRGLLPGDALAPRPVREGDGDRGCIPATDTRSLTTLSPAYDANAAALLAKRVLRILDRIE